jgi:hypothetical protein
MLQLLEETCPLESPSTVVEHVWLFALFCEKMKLYWRFVFYMPPTPVILEVTA